jgi:hypothetical protein
MAAPATGKTANATVGPRAAARRLKRTKRQVREMCKSGALVGAEKRGGEWLIPVDSVTSHAPWRRWLRSAARVEQCHLLFR